MSLGIVVVHVLDVVRGLSWNWEREREREWGRERGRHEQVRTAPATTTAKEITSDKYICAYIYRGIYIYMCI